VCEREQRKVDDVTAAGRQFSPGIVRARRDSAQIAFAHDSGGPTPHICVVDHIRPARAFWVAVQRLSIVIQYGDEYVCSFLGAYGTLEYTIDVFRWRMLIAQIRWFERRTAHHGPPTP